MGEAERDSVNGASEDKRSKNEILRRYTLGVFPYEARRA
jgi:hypothetical protein